MGLRQYHGAARTLDGQNGTGLTLKQGVLRGSVFKTDESHFVSERKKPLPVCSRGFFDSESNSTNVE